MRKLAALGALATIAIVAAFAAAPSASAYGRGSVYQIEISANNVGGVPGDGAWIWIGLNKDGTGDYTMADCIHTGSAGLNAASHSKGDVTWSDANGWLTIQGVKAIGGLVPVTIVVPDTYGHYVFNSDDIIQVPPNPVFPGFGGRAQTQVAP